MTSGLKLDYKGFTALEDPVAATLIWPLEREPGAMWSYEQATAQALCPIIERLTASSRLCSCGSVSWTYRGKQHGWLRSRKGDCLTYRSVLTSAREFALFGQLFLNRGRWNGKQLLSERFIAQAIVKHPYWRESRLHPDNKTSGGAVRVADVRELQRHLGGVDRSGYGFLAASTTSAWLILERVRVCAARDPEHRGTMPPMRTPWT